MKKQDETVNGSNAQQLKPSCARYSAQRTLAEPKFEIDGNSNYGDYNTSHKPPGNRHFIPRRAKLRCFIGKSISLYEKWRLMQYQSNCIMKKFLDLHGVNVSVLPPCVNYDLWKHPKWKEDYNKPLDEDPCPDCDVRFTADAEGVYRAKIAPASILVPSRWRKRPFMDTIILIGLPQHITVAYIKETSTQVFVEYVDPAGPSGDRRGCEEVQMWIHSYLGPRMEKTIKFYQAAKGINFQCDKNDVMCQTWIWYWVYFRLIRSINTQVLSRHVYRLGTEKKSLERVHRFNCWLADLYKLGFFTNESPSQTKVAETHTPQRPNPAARAEKKPSRMQTAFKKLMRKTSDNCFTRTYSADSSEEDEGVSNSSSSSSSSNTTATTDDLEEMSVTSSTDED
uniref:Uncharacterized protein n=1 Tax=Ciona savignyi TaxID=51511 RepID=H2Z8I1_CIOSA